MYHIQNNFYTIACSISPSCTPPTPYSELCRFSLELFYPHKLLDFVDHCVLFQLMKISSQTQSLYNFESLSLKHVQDSRIVHLTVLAPNSVSECLTKAIPLMHANNISIHGTWILMLM